MDKNAKFEINAYLKDEKLKVSIDASTVTLEEFLNILINLKKDIDTAMIQAIKEKEEEAKKVMAKIFKEIMEE